MIKFIALAVAAAATFSLTACSPKYTSMDNRTNINNSGGTNQGRIAGLANNNTGYRDGVYSATGDIHGNGNEQAAVTVRNGRIVDVSLISLNAQASATGSIAGNTTNNVSGAVPGISDNTTVGINSAGLIGNSFSNSYGTTDYYTILDPLRTRLTTAIISSQTPDVNITVVDGRLAYIVNNWKLAVKRALEKAGK